MNFIGKDKIAQFIANNLKVEFMAITVSEKEPFGSVLKPLVFEFPKLLQQFKQQLYDEVKRCTKEQMYAVKVTLEDEFLPTINEYLIWYQENKKHTEEYFPKHNPYDFVNSDVKLFKREILKYFPKIEIKPQPIKTKEDLQKEQNKLIPKVAIDEVFNYFEILTKTTNRNDEFYLTNEQLLTFINATFVECTPIKQNFNCNFNKDKKDVRSVFRKFQDNCSLREKNNKNLKQKYFDILNKSFEGFNKTDFDKWHETNSKIVIQKKQKAK